MGRTVVFCASTPMTPELRSVARDLGAAVAGAGEELAYGGTTTGLMAAVADGARAAGGRVVGVVPRAIAALGSVDRRVDELVEVETLGERKVAMLDGADRVVALAGGLGTLDELLEVLTMRQLGMLPPDLDVVVLDPSDHWAHLREQFAVLVATGTTRPTSVRVRWVRTVTAVVGEETEDEVQA